MAITSAPHESHRAEGRPERAAHARTAELYGSYGRTIGGLCRALLRDRSEAEDATQQVFLSAHRALLNGTDPREPAAWLATIARNECWARVRARMREPLATADVDAVAGLPDPLAEAIRRADLAALWAAIEELPRQQRDALLLREFGGLSYDELAEALAVTTPAVESLLFRARQRLRTRLEAAYAAVSGASWLEALLRLFAGSSPAVATKAVALGLGAAAVTGGAVVAPSVFDHRRPASRAPVAVIRAPAAAPAPPAPVAVAAAAAKAPVVFVATRRDESGASGRQQREQTTEQTDRQERRATTGDAPDQAAQAGPGGDGGNASSGDGGDTAAPAASGDGGGDSGGSGGDGGSTAAQPSPTTTTTTEQDGGGVPSDPVVDGGLTVTVPTVTGGDG